MPKDRKRKNMLIIACIMLFAILFTLVPSFSFSVTAARRNTGSVAEEYVRYQSRLQNIEKITDLEENGFRLLEDQVFAMPLQKVPEDTPEEAVDEVWFYAALDKQYHRLAVFLADDNGQILYKTDQLEANYCYPGELRQPIEKLASVSFQDVDNDSDTDIILIAQCHNDRGDYQEKSYKVGDVLFQEDGSFYRDYRISDKINRFDMNKNPACILNFVRDGRSTEFLYTAETYGELLSHNFRVIEEQSYTRNFEKLGKMKVVPGVYRMAEYDVFMIYLIDEQGNIVWSFQPMEDYDNLYALKGIQGKDLDGDGFKDLVVFAKYSYEGDLGELLVDTVCTVYYQRTAGFEKDKDFTANYECTEEDTLEALVGKIRAYWGWQIMIKILIVDDEKPICDLIDLNLSAAGYFCKSVQDGMKAIECIEREKFDLILLDIMLPGVDGFDIMEYIRPLKIPVIFITARGDVKDRVKGLRLGAEDYLVKPFDVVELLARVEVVLRRFHKTGAQLSAGDVVVDMDARMVTKAGMPVVLTNKEYGLLVLFIQNKNIALFKENLYEKVWGEEYDGDSRTLELHVQRLRKKMGWERQLVAVYKVGYRLEIA